MKAARKLAAVKLAVKEAPKLTVEEYLAAIPEPAQAMLREVRAVIWAACPLETTEVISYAIPAFSLGKPFFGYAAFKKHYSLFPFSGSFFVGFTTELVAYKGTKGSLHIPYDRPIPVKLIQKLVMARVAQISG